MRAVQKMMEGREFSSKEEASEFLREQLEGKKLEDIMAEYPPDPREEAQELAYRAHRAESEREAAEFCQRALELDPDNLDAALLLAQLGAETPAEAIEPTRRVLERAEEAFGADFIEENRGSFWQIVETRPYMRALAGLKTVLELSGAYDEAIRVGEKMLDLNPMDNQGVRYELLPLYLREGRLEAARDLIGRYEDDAGPGFLYCRLLERLLSDDEEGARGLLQEAHDWNPHLTAYLTGEKQPPHRRVQYYTPHEESEAIVAFMQIWPAWEAYPVALAWLRAVKKRLGEPSGQAPEESQE
jgi:tetratricopeptide (TPR) repeat protein